MQTGSLESDDCGARLTNLSPPPPWLAPMQEAFGDQLREGLDARSGTFEPPSSYPGPLTTFVREAEPHAAGPLAVSPDDRLALYHRQYWMRLFVGMQTAFPRTARVVGYWTFNHLVDLHLRVRPPAHWDLDRAGDGFAARTLDGLARIGKSGRRAGPDPLARPDTRRLDRFSVGRAVRADPLRARLLTVRRELGLVAQALRLDEAERACFAAPWSEPWVPSQAQLAELATTTLRLAPSVQMVRLDWDLKVGAAAADEHPSQAAPARRASPQALVLSRTADGSVAQPVPVGFARLLRAGDREPFGRALDSAGSECSDKELAELKEHLPRLSNLALQRGWWVTPR